MGEEKFNKNDRNRYISLHVQIGTPFVAEEEVCHYVVVSKLKRRNELLEIYNLH